MKNSRKLLGKEIKLAASPLSWLFIAFALMTFIPAYPILVAAFFVCFGVFQSVQSGRENNDILYTVLLPVSKTDAVKAKYRFTVMIQMIAFALSTVLTLLRMIFMTKAGPYLTNPMMNANQAYLFQLDFPLRLLQDGVQIRTSVHSLYRHILCVDYSR